jgi:predicted Zn-dependent protease
MSTGSIERTARMNQLAGVLAHEIGHVTMRHSVKQMQAAQKANVGLSLACILTSICESQVAGAAVQVGGGVVFAKFSRDDEREADRSAIDFVMRAGIDPAGSEMFRILITSGSATGWPDAWFRTTRGGGACHETEGHYRTIASSRLRGLAQDTPQYQQFSGACRDCR